MYASFKCELDTTNLDINEDDRSYIENMASPSARAFKHEGYTDAENILAAVIADKHLYNNVSCESPWDDPSKDEGLSEEIWEELRPAFPYDGDEDEMRAAIKELVAEYGKHEFFRKCISDNSVESWPNLKEFAPAKPDDEDEPWFFNNEEFVKMWDDPASFDQLMDDIIEDLDTPQYATLIDTSEIDSLWEQLKDDNEVYEWWTCSNWLTHQLRGVGEIVVRGVWGRQCTGQGLLLDGTFQEIARELLQRNRR